MSLPGDRIRELRQRNGMTLDDVAKHLGINRQAVYKYEQGIVTNIPLDKIEKMSELFCVSPGYLSGWTDDQPPEPQFPVTQEARIISFAVDKMPPADRERALKLLEAVYADYFEKEEDKIS